MEYSFQCVLLYATLKYVGLYVQKLYILIIYFFHIFVFCNYTLEHDILHFKIGLFGN